jgi:drug/metabolite transporter (DMT)-like permease
VVETLRRRGLKGRVLLAFAAIYLVWGSTFLAIRIAITDLPPLFMCAARLVSAGALMLAWARLRGDAWPRGAEWRHAAIVGILLPGVGNSAVTLGETHVASGLVALLVATIPLWVALLSALDRRGEKPTALAWTGLAIGFAGIGLLMGPGLARPGVEGRAVLWGLFPVAGSFSWAWGSLWSRRVRMPASPVMGTGIGLLAAGIVVTMVSAGAGELARPERLHAGWPSLTALAYLVVFGSVVGFSAYQYLLRQVAPATVSTYAFVNPVVAMVLGGLFAGESLSPRTAVASLLVLASVVLITLQRLRRAPRPVVASGDVAA